MFQAIGQRKCRIQFAGGSVHGLQEEMTELHLLKLFRLCSRLRVDKLQLIAAELLENCAGLWTDANPIEARWSRDGSVCLHSYLEATCVQRINQLGVDLQKGFATGANYETIPGFGARRPFPVNGRCESFGGGEASAATPICIGKIRIAEFADSRRAVPLAS